MPRPSVEAERREQILRAVCEVVSDSGFTSLRVTDVAELAQISTGSVHYYFETKQDLIQAAFEWNFARSLERRKSILSRKSSALDRLRAYVDSFLRQDAQTIASWYLWAEFWAAALHDPDLRELNERVYGEWRTMISEIIRSGQAEGAIRPGDPTVLANTLVGAIDGLAIQALLGSSRTKSRQNRAVFEHLIDAMAVDSD